MNMGVKGPAAPFSGVRNQARIGSQIALLCCVACATAVFAANKRYPIAGNVVALGTKQETTGGRRTPAIHRTYTVKTATKLFVLECPFSMNGFHIHSPSECGGSKNIAVGDVVHFQVDEFHAFVQTDKGKEQRLNILSEAVTEEAAKESDNP